MAAIALIGEKLTPSIWIPKGRAVERRDFLAQLSMDAAIVPSKAFHRDPQKTRLVGLGLLTNFLQEISDTLKHSPMLLRAPGVLPADDRFRVDAWNKTARAFDGPEIPERAIGQQCAAPL
jgi:hypothetical protein